ncbi:Acetyltransferase (GNAT) domain-containing protein [Burkholderia sp. WP9]|uniref:GNAT family N-acetyltransferase n=1 Tax=Burkholderia sp. WP9 TaxID=1500263 RepID=UPI000895B453|nr:GNAT family N-acetyltransferase [Burkholderia sp. WP9]SED24998.1 Acetyltransferase (GNAT) domain-containing protein [Burkholderia sp. WP9]
MTLEDIKAFLDCKSPLFDKCTVVKAGEVQRNDGTFVPFEIQAGWDLGKAHWCDKNWGIFNLNLLKFIKEKDYSDEDRTEILESIQIDDSHWEWLKKAIAYRTAEYDWLFLMADDVPQGACLIYHPKKSELAAGDIFYIEYIASAPWNRKNPMSSRRFSGIGSLLIKAAMAYATDELKLRQGFSLHALPRAVPFYEQIGMKPFAALDKETLRYFEMPQATANEFEASR